MSSSSALVLRQRVVAFAAPVAAFSLGDASTSTMVKRMSIEEFLSTPMYDTPTLIEGIASPATVESLAEKLVELLGDEEVQLQRKTRMAGSASTEVYDVTLQETVEHLMESCHDDSFFAFCEGLLPLADGSSQEDDIDSDSPTHMLSTKFTQIREAPFPNTENWFDYFPPSVRPSDAVILAGEGSTSTLHRDPFEWTGTSLCIEGTKIWRFILPPTEDEHGVASVDDALLSYRLDSVAWGDDTKHNGSEESSRLVLSAGWQSDMTLYETRSEDALTAIELSELEHENEEAYRIEVDALGCDPSYLTPSPDAKKALQSLRPASGSSDSNSQAEFVTAIQRAGDLLLIPAHCWHMTYSPVPSIAIASQRCSSTVDGTNVIRHILNMLAKNENCGLDDSIKIPDILMRKKYEEGTGKEVVDALLCYLTELDSY